MTVKLKEKINGSISNADYATSAGSANAVAWGNVTGKPSTYTPASHEHAASNITSGTLSSDRLPTVPVSKGGTGATAKGATLLSNIGISSGTAAPPSSGTAGTIYIQY